MTYQFIFASDSFHEFANSYGFEYVTSSPTYAQSNRKVENAVKMAESLLEKGAQSRRDQHFSFRLEKHSNRSP